MVRIQRIPFDPRAAVIERTVPLPFRVSVEDAKAWIVRIDGDYPADPDALKKWMALDIRLSANLSPAGTVLNGLAAPKGEWRVYDSKGPKSWSRGRGLLWSAWIEAGKALYLTFDPSLFAASDALAFSDALSSLLRQGTANVQEKRSVAWSLSPQPPDLRSALQGLPSLDDSERRDGLHVREFQLGERWNRFRKERATRDPLELAAALLATAFSYLGTEETFGLIAVDEKDRLPRHTLLAHKAAKDFEAVLKSQAAHAQSSEKRKAADWAAVSLRQETKQAMNLIAGEAFAIEWSLSDEGNCLLIGRTDTISAALLERLPDILIRLLGGESLGSLALPLWEKWNRKGKAFPETIPVYALLNDSFARFPDKIAIESSRGSMRYAELDKAANRIASFLQSQGIGPGDLIGLGIPRSPWMVAALLGILRAGAAYVPVDPNFPKERLRYMLEDAKVKACLCEDKLLDIIPKTALVIPDERLDKLSDESWVPKDLAEGATAYVIYTSGSTGQPKGVILGHRSVVNFLLSMKEAPGMDPSDHLLAVTTLSFDIAVLEIFLPLMVGASLFLASTEEAKNGAALRQLIEENDITHFQATASTFRLLLDAGWQGAPLKKALCGGEAFPLDVAKRLHGLVPEIWNMYGPTETTVWSTIYRLEGRERMIPIGHPIDNTKVFILDDNLEPCLPGEKGEIYIGGAGLALGYLNRPDLTAERFLQIPALGELAYKTGDIGRHRWNGMLEIFGRADHQVKLRGYRMELGEIEAVISSMPLISICIVSVQSFGDDDQRLVAHLTCDAGWDERTLRQQLKDHLPPYMVPQHYVVLPSFPLLPNGKIDRKNLPHALDADKKTEERVDKSRDQAASRLTQERIVPPTVLAPTPSQNRMLYVESLDPETRVHNLLSAWTIRGPFHLEAFQAAWNAIVAEQESLRMSIAGAGEETHLLVHPPFPVRISLRGVQDAEEIQKALAEIGRQKLSIRTSPSWQCGLFRLAEDHHVFFLLSHHIFWDGFSYAVLWRQLQKHYRAFLDHGQCQAQAPAFNYSQYAMLRNKDLRSESIRKQLAFWQQKFQNVPEPLELAYDFPRPKELTHEADAAKFAWTAEFDASLLRFAKQNDSTPYHVLLAAYALLLHRMSRQDEIVIGTPVHGRSRSEVFELLGNFINVIPLRISFREGMSFLDLLAQVRQTLTEAMANAELPFEEIIASIKVPRDPSRTPLYTAMFFFQDQSHQTLTLGENPVTTFPFASQTVDSDLVFWVERAATQSQAGFNFRKDLWEKPSVAAMASALPRLLSAYLDNPRLTIEAAALAPQNAGAEGNPLKPPYPTLWDALEKSADEHADRIALRTLDGQALSYRDLRIRAARIATLLEQKGVKRGEVVGLCMNRRGEMVATLWAILSLGASYLPLDPLYPNDRLRGMAEEAPATLIVAEFEYSDRFENLSIPVWSIDLDRRVIDQTEIASPRGPEPSDNAYIIYTSGSTGKPKGVEIQHSAAVHFLAAIARNLSFSIDMRLLAVTTISFDISVLELFVTLSQGGEIILVGHEEVSDSKILTRAMETYSVNVLQATPATWRLLVESSWTGRQDLKALTGGEALPRDLAEKLLPLVAELWNVYGPTEATVWATAERIVDAKQAITIGRPLPSYEAYILDAKRRPLPQGTMGDLYLAGPALARGYRNQPDLTAERFVPHAFKSGARMYDTGDLARFRSDGRIEYISRRDNQVKLRGFRIELGEIEAVMAKHPAIRQAVCVVREDNPGDKRLVAYVVLNEALEFNVLLQDLKSQLPQYMLPNHFVALKEFPLTSSGKIDKKRLPAPNREASKKGKEALSPREEKIAAIFRDFLGIGDIGPQDGFFELGGHSLLALKTLQRLQKDLGLDLRIRDLLLKNISQLAASLEELP